MQPNQQPQQIPGGANGTVFPPPGDIASYNATPKSSNPPASNSGNNQNGAVSNQPIIGVPPAMSLTPSSQGVQQGSTQAFIDSLVPNINSNFNNNYLTANPNPSLNSNLNASLSLPLAGAQAGGATKQRQARQQKTPKAKVMPTELDIEGPMSNEAYQAALSDNQLTVSPQALGFLPSNYWLNLDSTFGDLVTKFFQRKNNANCRFPHKLYNALSIVEQDPKMYNLLGVKWLTDEVFKVDKLIFGRVLGISSIDGGLFHRQGNFPSHGFCEISPDDFDNLKKSFDLSDVDQDRVRLMHHAQRMFYKGCTEDSVNKCKWGANDKKEE
ncbi:hypothetical protein TRFO_37668 [Tritrichomonas foetus]|uniref:Initiator binding domain-containing protein n=1 Tax=Tritrichomonas foetus TaxID=1144522 RepID=A0A1J4JAE8_9EUKA|nr:hypothetical protein TRFO_37668 [Tritrichomonas foetus]|eukprot:OHS96154.1 hypothetical protein TRFO_37668 [Tritrichomonas foetus]